MFLIGQIIEILKIRKFTIVIYFLSNFWIILFYYLLSNENEIIYPLILSIVIFIIYVIYEFSKMKKLKSDLKKSVKYPLELFDDETEGYLIFRSINSIHEYYYNKLEKLNNEFNNRNILFSKWIHNIKTSIFIIDMANENLSKNIKNKEEYIEDIKNENEKLKRNLEECLNVIRLDDFSKDYNPKLFNLKELSQQSINNKKRDFIYKKVFPSVEIDSDLNVYTDKKWIIYVIEQILNNSIKYSKNNEKNYVSIYSKRKDKSIVLSIKDNGIGIEKEDITRIFEPFFTGNNGRETNNSTGIGLYMVKYICDKLNHKVFIESKINSGTTVNIEFLQY
jgi:signal transduction histidine kinase